MAERYVKSVGAYLPILRLERQQASAAMRWSGLAGPRTGRRSVAGWDEDALTMAAEAARQALAGDTVDNLRCVTFASTSAPFIERQQSVLMLDVLQLDRSLSTLDVSGSRRCAVSALARALTSGEAGDELIVAGERRRTAAGNPLELAWGDGGAAAIVSERGCARLLGHHSRNVDLVDIYSSPERPAPYQSEERFIRDVAVSEVLAPAVAEVCAAAGIEPGEIDVAVVPEPVTGTYRVLKAKVGLKAANLSEVVQAKSGDLGAAHALFGLALALESCALGAKVLLVGFGSGCDALVLEVARPLAGQNANATLATGVSFADYVRFLSLTGSLDIDWGPRSETEQKASASVLARHGRDFTGFVGGRDASGNVQFPKTPVPVSPEPGIRGAWQDVVLADAPAKVLSITTDRLNFTPDPPFHFGLVQFDNGARVLMEFCDSQARSPVVGDPVRMRFRVKSIDRKRGFRTYFWKAAPMTRPVLEG